MEIETLVSDFLQAEIFPWLCKERARKKLNQYRRMYPDFDKN